VRRLVKSTADTSTNNYKICQWDVLRLSARVLPYAPAYDLAYSTGPYYDYAPGLNLGIGIGPVGIGIGPAWGW
jgi:hypothetical protein